MATNINVTWVQGQDLDLSMMYKEGATVDTAIPVDLSTGYTMRMDIVDSTGTRLWTFNSDPADDQEPDDSSEATLSNAVGTSNIDIRVDRGLTLPGGALFTSITADPPVLTFFSDIFLRAATWTDDPRVSTVGKQWKIATLTIAVEKSYTLWQ